MRRALMLAATAALTATTALAEPSQVVLGQADAPSRGEGCIAAKNDGAGRAITQAAGEGRKARITEYGDCDCDHSYERARNPAMAHRQWICSVNVRFEVVARDD